VDKQLILDKAKNLAPHSAVGMINALA